MRETRTGKAREVDLFLHRIGPYLDSGAWSDPNAARQILGETYYFLLKVSAEIERLRRSHCQWIGRAVDAWDVFQESNLTAVVEELCEDPNCLVRVFAKLYQVQNLQHDLNENPECLQFLSAAFRSTSRHRPLVTM